MPSTDVRIEHLSRLEQRAEAVDRIALVRRRMGRAGGGPRRRGRAGRGLPAEIASSPTRDGRPSTWTAEADGWLVGAAQVKRREVPTLDALEHWLGGVHVDATFRERGVARRSIDRCVDEAMERGVGRLFLQTETYDVGLYARIGWEPATFPDGIVHERPVGARRVRAANA